MSDLYLAGRFGSHFGCGWQADFRSGHVGGHRGLHENSHAASNPQANQRRGGRDPTDGTKVLEPTVGGLRDDQAADISTEATGNVLDRRVRT